MTFALMLETLILGPLKLVFEFVFYIANHVINNPGLSIISLSLIINVLVFPLYKRADDMQTEARDIENKLRDGVQHIKKAFSGDERMMMLQTYYRQNNYRPTHAIKGSVSLLLQIPFFMAAYGFLSNLEELQGVSLGPISDLGNPDGLLVIGGVAINILPIVMTAINFVSSTIYLKGFPLKNKLQIYGMAIFFLIFLYPSPSGLVFYWTCNNFFSLCKTILYKVKNPQKILGILGSVAGIALIVFSLFVYEGTYKKRLFLLAVGLLLQVGLFLPLFKKSASKLSNFMTDQPNNKLFTAGSCFLTVLFGALISSTLIADSPQEFVDVSYFYHPLWHVVSSLCFAAGTFMIWLRVFYWLSKPKIKVVFDKAVWVLSGLAVVNYMFFGTKLGNISADLKYDENMSFAISEMLINIAVMIVLFAIMFFIVTKWRKAATSILLVATLTIGVMSGANVHTIKKSIDSIVFDEISSDLPEFNLDKTGKNVVVIMLDRALGLYFPYIINENRELKEKFDGFTYYENTVSFGGSTNLASPALLGGYEYTPVEMNKRDNELLVDKHNEALLVMPVLFSENDFDVTVFDPTYANYSWIPDLTVFNDYPEISADITKGKFETDEQKEQGIVTRRRNFFYFSLMKGMPLLAQQFIYSGGSYRKTESWGVQTINSPSVARGFNKNFMKNYQALDFMPDMTQITENGKNTYLYLSNDITHEPALLQTPEYEPSIKVDNTRYDAEHADRFTLNGKTIDVSSDIQMSHYHANMAALIKIGNWLDYLRENDVYDNTKIIIVADHGRELNSSDDYNLSTSSDTVFSMESLYPLFLVKNFNSKGFKISDEFMTNADVPTIATKDLIKNPVNPFTGKPINNDEKTAHDQMLIYSNVFDIEENNGKVFLPAKWLSVSDNIHDKQNWDYYEEEIVLKEHELP